MAKQDLGELGFKESNVETPGGKITDRVDNQDQWTPRIKNVYWFWGWVLVMPFFPLSFNSFD